LRPGDLLRAGDTLTQRSYQTRGNAVVIKLDLAGMADGQRAGLCHFSKASSFLGVVQTGAVRSLVYGRDGQTTPGPALVGPALWLKSTWGLEGLSQYSYSTDGRNFTDFGPPSPLSWGFYRGDRIGIFCYNDRGDAGWVDVDYFSYRLQGPAATEGLPETADPAAAARAVEPRTALPPPADDPLRPWNTRLLKPGTWTDDAGTDDFGNSYDLYKRSPYGTWSNYDEALANPFPVPSPLILKDGGPVPDAGTWWRRRRPEILRDFQTEIYGRVPAATPPITWEVAPRTGAGGESVKLITGRIDNSAFPAATPTIRLALTLPAHRTGPVPVIVVVTEGGRDAASGPRDQVLARGWGYATFAATSLQADNGAGLTRGIIGLMDRGQPRRDPAAWGALTAWAWGLSRAVDYLQTDPDVDARHLGVEGHSRWGKTALWAAASDERWAIVFASCSGEGGAKLLRRNFGETTDNLAGSHWMAGNFRKYGGHWNDLPVDADDLIALVAPRPVFVTGATQDPWSDPRGEFLAAARAGAVYRLLGRPGLEAEDPPPPNAAIIAGEVAYREHVGAHTDLPDWPVFLSFAARYLEAPSR
jgi:hypothetical protein